LAVARGEAYKPLPSSETRFERLLAVVKGKVPSCATYKEVVEVLEAANEILADSDAPYRFVPVAPRGFIAGRVSPVANTENGDIDEKVRSAGIRVWQLADEQYCRGIPDEEDAYLNEEDKCAYFRDDVVRKALSSAIQEVGERRPRVRALLLGARLAKSGVDWRDLRTGTSLFEEMVHAQHHLNILHECGHAVLSRDMGFKNLAAGDVLAAHPDSGWCSKALGRLKGAGEVVAETHGEYGPAFYLLRVKESDPTSAVHGFWQRTSHNFLIADRANEEHHWSLARAVMGPVWAGALKAGYDVDWGAFQAGCEAVLQGATRLFETVGDASLEDVESVADAVLRGWSLVERAAANVALREGEAPEGDLREALCCAAERRLKQAAYLQT
jgi:hypothetical protein